MRERVPCEFFLVRYVPDVVKGEFVNIGVMLREAAAEPGRRPENRVRFTRDWSRVRCIDRSADIGLLEGLEQEIGERIQSAATAREPRAVLDVLQDSLSNSIQMTDARPSLAENLASELEQLMRMYVEPLETRRSQDGKTRRTGRPAIQTAMRTEFERAGVWGLMNKRVSAERYTRKGDPLHLDCGYRRTEVTGGGLRLFQAVSLEGDLEMAKVLAYTAPRLREGAQRVEGAPLELTAVVEPLRSISTEDGEAWERFHFGVETMEQQAIRVVTVADLARVAATARHELGF